MQWAEQLREEYSKIAKENQLSGLKKGDVPSDKILSNEKVDTNKQIANDIGFKNKESYRQAQYIWNNADEEMILLSVHIELLEKSKNSQKIGQN
ncbi:MAG: hypothetical protein ACLSTJ_01740 [Clostridium neonatale]